MTKFHLLGKYTPENKAIAPIGAKFILCGKSLNNIPNITKNKGNNLKSFSLFISSIISFVAVVAHRWNQILPNLLETFEKLKKIGLLIDQPGLISNLPQIDETKEGL